MSKSVNKVVLLGTLGRDPEVKYTPGGTAVAKFSMATNERFKDRDGNWQDRTEWHNLVAWQRTAEIIGEYVKKGDRLYIEGKLQTSSWDDKQTGEKKYRTEIVVQDVCLLGGKRSNDDVPESSGHDRQSNAVTSSHPITDDDIPF